MSDLPNPRKGEAVITIDGEDYLLKYKFDNIVRLQKDTGKNVNELFSAIGQGDLEVLLKMIHSGIAKGKDWPEKYGKRAPTMDQLSDLMDPEDDQLYMIAVTEALKGAEFAEAIKKKYLKAQEMMAKAIEEA